VLLTKCDLVPHLDVDLAKVHDALARVMPSAKVIEVSAKTGQGMDEWVAWLEEQRAPFAPTIKLANVALGRGHVHGPGDGHSHDHDHGHGPSHAHSHAPGPGRGGSRDP
jgi:hydrogenase nickel incorporation protein HypB